jgi:hypothetical protein
MAQLCSSVWDLPQKKSGLGFKAHFVHVMQAFAMTLSYH